MMNERRVIKLDCVIMKDTARERLIDKAWLLLRESRC